MGKSGKPKKVVETEIEKGEKPEKAEKKNGLALKKCLFHLLPLLFVSFVFPSFASFDS